MFASFELSAQVGDMGQDVLAAEAQYQQYCALCHGADRQGYVNDNAPTLRNASIYELSAIIPFMAIAYGRPGTPMGPYLDEMSGPMTEMEIRRLAAWLSREAGVEPNTPSGADLEPVVGDIASGALIYQQECAECHGENGQGGEGTALGNPTMLATTPDKFLRQAIVGGRDGTRMEGFADTLSDTQINNVTAFLRSRAAGWDVETTVLVKPPTPDEYVLNPRSEAPQLELKNGIYVSAQELYAAIKDQRRMVILDTRVPYFWAMAHIGGAVPVPYYSDFDTIVDNLPRDDTVIVAYCECPRAAAESVIVKLRKMGFENTAVLWEGYAGWTALGYPVAVGKITE